MKSAVLILLVGFVALSHTLETNENSPPAEATCKDNCVRADWYGGKIENGKCWCYNLGQTGEVTKRSLTEIQLSQHAVIMAEHCKNSCVNVGWYGGVMENGLCWCYNLGQEGEMTKRILADILEPQATPAQHAQCNDECLKAKWDKGEMEWGHCWCCNIRPSKIFKMTLDEVLANSRDGRTFDDYWW